MGSLDDAFAQTLFNAISNPKVWARLVRAHFEQRGISLSDYQVRRFQKYLSGDATGKLVFRFRDEQISPNAKASLEHAGAMELDIDQISADFESYIKSVVDQVGTQIPEIAEEAAEAVMRSLNRTRPQMLREHRQHRMGFERRLARSWGRSINLMEALLVVAQEAGEKFLEEEHAQALANQDLVFECLIRLHAKACQVFSEVMTLARTGHADGAMARWRALHELAVVAMFISERGQFVAERYIAHESIDICKAATIYSEKSDRLGLEALDPSELPLHEMERDRLIAKYGKVFGRDYGWAAEALSTSSPNFAAIEKATNLDHMRPYYKLASNNVHASARGIFFSLGLTQEQSNLVLAGPSDAGLADPGHASAISLMQITVTMLLTQTTLDRLIVSQVLQKMSDQVGDALQAAQARVKAVTDRG